jgi:hypothetical protein
VIHEWNTIDKAPLDGTPILVMQNNWPGEPNGLATECSDSNTYVASWWPGERNGNGAWVCYMSMVKDPICPIKPTHWMPLPESPTKQSSFSKLRKFVLNAANEVYSGRSHALCVDAKALLLEISR